jgi:lipopolysaccharide transport system ATP-binding protein
MFTIATRLVGAIILMNEWISAGDATVSEKAHRRMIEIVGGAGILVIASRDP